MKPILSKSPILALVVVVGLAAGTALVAGYVDGPGQGAAVTANSKCADCPRAGTEDCCKVTGTCEKCDACATPCEQGTCAAKPATDCCQEKAQAASCSPSGCQAEAMSPCGAGGCALTE
jgi:hypothetical protein